MNVGQLKKLLENIDDDIKVVSSFIVESGMSYSCGFDQDVDVEVNNVGQFNLEVSDPDNIDFDNDVFDFNEEMLVNKKKVLVISSSSYETCHE